MIRNAKIKSTMLGIEDHDIMSFWIFIEWPGGGVGFGGYALDQYDKKDKLNRIGSGYGYQSIRKILETLELTSWEKLPGTLIRIDENGPGTTLDIIGHVMKDQWFNLKDYMKELENK
jgi:hypothetical protein